MELGRAKEIIQALADGVDPYTGERFPAEGPYQRADTVRALYAVLEAAESGTKPKKPVDPNKPRAGGKWTEGEEEKLRNAFHADTPISEMAAEHGRTPGAITARLVRLGLIEDNATNRAGRDNAPADRGGLRPPISNASIHSPRSTQDGPIDPNDCPF